MREMVVSQAMPFPLCMPDAESVPFCVLDIERDWYHGMERVWLARLGKIVKDANSLTISMIYQIISYKLLTRTLHTISMSIPSEGRMSWE